MTQSIVLINQSTAATDAELTAIAAAITMGLARDFAPVWGTPATVRAQLGANPGDWPIYIKDRTNIAGDLGFHLDQGTPSANVFAADIRDYGMNLCAVIDHEVKEALADPTATMTMPYEGGYITKEVCDPIPDVSQGIDLGNGMMGSNFVYPSWFEPNGQGPFDARRILTEPFQLGVGGYRTVYLPGATQWQMQAMHTPAGGVHYLAMKRGRNAFRAVGAPPPPVAARHY